MNWPRCNCDKARLAAYLGAIVGTFLIVGALAWLMMQRVPPPPIDQARVELRRKNLVEMHAADQAAMETYAWIDPGKGIVRLPVDRAVELLLETWKDPAAGRSNLLLRLEKATAKPPEKPNVYE